VTWYLGVDPGSHRAGACLLSEQDGVIPRAFPLARGDLAARLAQLDRDLTGWLTDALANGLSATCTVVENPGVARTGSSLPVLAAYGVCLATAYALMPCPTFELLNSQWRARTPLGGGAKKPQIVEWAARHGVRGEDEAMAFGCAWAARELHRGARRAAA
jgi:Holliday junction resolvasome RuvABC endonuclease subunit